MVDHPCASTWLFPQDINKCENHYLRFRPRFGILSSAQLVGTEMLFFRRSSSGEGTVTRHWIELVFGRLLMGEGAHRRGPNIFSLNDQQDG